MVTLIEKGDAFEVFDSAGKAVGWVRHTICNSWRWEAEASGLDGMEATLAAAIEVLTGYCPAGGVAIK